MVGLSQRSKAAKDYGVSIVEFGDITGVTNVWDATQEVDMEIRRAWRLCHFPNPQGPPVCEVPGMEGTWKPLQTCQLNDIEWLRAETQMHI